MLSFDINVCEKEVIELNVLKAGDYINSISDILLLILPLFVTIY